MFPTVRSRTSFDKIDRRLHADAVGANFCVIAFFEDGVDVIAKIDLEVLIGGSVFIGGAYTALIETIDLVQRHAGSLDDQRQREGIEIAYAIVLRKAGLRRHAHRGHCRADWVRAG